MRPWWSDCRALAQVMWDVIRHVVEEDPSLLSCGYTRDSAQGPPVDWKVCIRHSTLRILKDGGELLIRPARRKGLSMVLIE